MDYVSFNKKQTFYQVHPVTHPFVTVAHWCSNDTLRLWDASIRIFHREGMGKRSWQMDDSLDGWWLVYLGTASQECGGDERYSIIWVSLLGFVHFLLDALLLELLGTEPNQILAPVFRSHGLKSTRRCEPAMFMSASPQKKKLERIARSFGGFVAHQTNKIHKSGCTIAMCCELTSRGFFTIGESSPNPQNIGVFEYDRGISTEISAKRIPFF